MRVALSAEERPCKSCVNAVWTSGGNTDMSIRTGVILRGVRRLAVIAVCQRASLDAMSSYFYKDENGGKLPMEGELANPRIKPSRAI